MEKDSEVIPRERIPAQLRIDHMGSVRPLLMIVLGLFIIWPCQNTASGLFTNLVPLLRQEIGIGALAYGVIMSVRSATSTIAGFWSGWQMDWIGRRSVFVAGGVMLFLGFAMNAVATDYNTVLVAGGVVTGIGMGLTFSVGNIYLAEWSPTKVRAKWNKIARVAPADTFSSLIAVGSIGLGWRAGMWIGAIIPMIGAVIAMMLPESPRWMQSRGKWADADKMLSKIEAKAKVKPYEPKPGEVYKLPEKEKIAVWEIFVHGYWKRTVPLLFISCAQWGGARTIMYWLPVLLADQLGAAMSIQIMLGIGTASYIVGAIIGFTGIVERGQRRDWNILAQALQFVFMVIFMLNTAWWWALVFGMLWAGVGGFAVPVYAAELYPTRIRGFAVSFTGYVFGKLFSVVSPMIIAVIYIWTGQYYGPFVWAAAMHLMSLVSYLFLPRKTAQIAMEITGETKATEAAKTK